MRNPGDAGPDGGGRDGGGRLLAGRYRVASQLGRGGMGVVWRAVDEVLGREVAVKELRTYTDAGEHELAELHTRMQREARAAARVRHSGVIAVHDVAQHEGRPLIVMELVEGPSLADVLDERGTLDPVEAARIGAAVLDALAAAHAVGVLHRDVKPGNILLDRRADGGEGRVVLTDFGIAAMDDPGDGKSTRLTSSGELVGSLDYLAPERASGAEPGPPSDVWALGATLYAAVEGVSPFRRTSTWSTLAAIVTEPLPEPRNAGVLAPALAELLHKDPASRADASRAATLLKAVASGAALPPPPASGGAPWTPYTPTSRDAAAQGAGPGQGPGPGGFGPPPAPEPAPHPSPSPPVSAPRGKQRLKVVAAAVATVLAAGGGVTYALVSQHGDDERSSRASDTRGPGGEGGEAAPGDEDARNGRIDKGERDKGDGREKKTSRPSPGRSASASGKPGAAAGGGPGGKDDGGSKDSGKGDGGGADGGGSGGKDDGGKGSGGGDGGGSGGGGGGPAPAPVCHGIGGGKFNCEVWRGATSYDGGHKPVGKLNAGTNYFYCQVKKPQRETYGKWTNVWWARTDDDSGNVNVYVSDVYIKGGDNDKPLPGLPVC
ncbi:hypothetical protein GCM10009801_11510 [Streptomyces albiaxialis]|uniref:non-specific serine/threonine protein kinase n=1 Tax=Streptomyces albiaxialis TaxID=329523 RepID=A0ABN2VLY7_9ACTN